MIFRIRNPKKELAAQIEQDVHHAIIPLIEKYSLMSSDFGSFMLHMWMIERALSHQIDSYYIDSKRYIDDPGFDHDDKEWWP